MLLQLSLLGALFFADTLPFPFDPVEASFGRQIEGEETWTRTRGRFTYRFASAETAAIFDADPSSFEIQLGGSCARMGPLSGVGDPSIYTVYQGRIYIFASEDCRAGFLDAPQKRLLRAEPKPRPNAEAVRKGRGYLARAIQRVGGKQALRELQSLHLTDHRTQGEGESASTVRTELYFDMEGNASWIQTSGDGERSAHIRGEVGTLVAGDDVFPLSPSQRRAILHKLHGEPLWLLSQRNAGAFQCWAEPDLGNRYVLACYLDGMTTRLLLAPDGEIVGTLRRDRDPAVGFTEVRSEFAEAVPLGPLQVPLERKAWVKATPSPALDRHWNQHSFNAAAPEVPPLPKR